MLKFYMTEGRFPAYPEEIPSAAVRYLGSLVKVDPMLGDVAAALRLFRELLPDRERVLGPDHPGTFTTRDNIAYWIGQCGDLAGALRLYRELPDRERVLGLDHPTPSPPGTNIATCARMLGDNGER